MVLVVSHRGQLKEVIFKGMMELYGFYLKCSMLADPIVIWKKGVRKWYVK